MLSFDNVVEFLSTRGICYDEEWDEDETATLVYIHFIFEDKNKIPFEFNLILVDEDEDESVSNYDGDVRKIPLKYYDRWTISGGKTQKCKSFKAENMTLDDIENTINDLAGG